MNAKYFDIDKFVESVNSVSEERKLKKRHQVFIR